MGTQPLASERLREDGIGHLLVVVRLMVEIDDQLYDVVAEGEFIDGGVQVEVTEVEGNRIVVRQVM